MSLPLDFVSKHTFASVEEFINAGPDNMIPCYVDPPEDGNYFVYLGCTVLPDEHKYTTEKYISRSKTPFYVGWQSNRVTHWGYIKEK